MLKKPLSYAVSAALLLGSTYVYAENTSSEMQTALESIDSGAMPSATSLAEPVANASNIVTENLVPSQMELAESASKLQTANEANSKPPVLADKDKRQVYSALDKDVSQVKPLTLPKKLPQNYSAETFVEDAKAIQWGVLGTAAAVTALGAYTWDWGGDSFHLGGEKWFQKSTGSMGMDKLGHAYSTYVMTDLFSDYLKSKGRSPEQAALSAFLLAEAMMLYVEVFDGFSKDHGFSYEDLVMNTAGAALAYARQRYPQLKDLLDYRMEYNPSGDKGSGIKGFRPLSDYSGQKYHLVWKMAGVPALKDTPLRYVELQTGYYARGFSKKEKAEGATKTRHAFVGVGVNLNELLFGKQEANEGLPKYAGRKFFEHVQLPVYYKVIKNR
ncbi:MAG: DUF2279 domain-containing protein [Neisseria sp.]|nr:DUF2279 domain-containing protein [Neisseria sp.]